MIRSKGNGLIKIITGLRRSGKSFLLKKLFRQHLLDDGVKEDHIIIIDMESRKNKPFKDPDYLLDWVEKEMKDDETYYIIIDEVQEVNDFVEVLSTLSVTEGTDVYVTGSNSRFLSSDVVTEFRGVVMKSMFGLCHSRNLCLFFLVQRKMRGLNTLCLVDFHNS